MNDQELKTKLERALHFPITVAEWRYVKRAWLEEEDLLSTDRLEYKAMEDWDGFVTLAKDDLDRLRCHEEEKVREQSGELAYELEPGTMANIGLGQSDNGSVGLSDRTSARSRALSALDRLRAGDIKTQRSRIASARFPRGGTDDTVPQWVIMIGVEAWVPPEDVKDAYHRLQRAVLAQHRPPKTAARTFQVAQFVWEEERAYGKRPSWPVLYKRWNEWPLTEPFSNSESFRRSFERGAAATPPAYVTSELQMTNLVRSRDGEGMFDAWVSSLRE
jgi:hypothetical protein